MKDEELYKRTIKDLEIKLSSNDEYELLKASGLIRQLLIDGDVSLAITVKRQYNIKLRFRYVDTKSGYSGTLIAMNPSTWSIQDGLDPETIMTRSEIIEGSLDDFLAVVVLIFESKHLTVKDVVTFLANVMGGIHAGKPLNYEHEAMEKINFQFGNLSAAVNQIKSIGRIILRTLQPLNEKIGI